GSAVGGRGHHAAVGARAEHRQVLAGLDRGELAVEREEITGLTDRAHDVDHFLGSTAVVEGDDLVMGIVVAGPHEVRHPRVHYDEILATGMLAVQHFGDEYAGLRDAVTPRLAQQREPGLPDRRRHCGGEVARTRRLLVVVTHAASPA